MPDQIALFGLPVLSWHITNGWLIPDPYGVPIDPDKTVREWIRECPHSQVEYCDGCATPEGWALVQESLARAAARNDG